MQQFLWTMRVLWKLCMTHVELWELSRAFKKTQSGFIPAIPGGGMKWETTDPILFLEFGRRKFKFWLGFHEFWGRCGGSLYLQVYRDQEIAPEVRNLQSKSWSPNSLLASAGIPVWPLGLDPFYFPPQDVLQDLALTKYPTFCCLSCSQFISAPSPLSEWLTNIRLCKFVYSRVSHTIP